jgi:hypothetical protein
MPRKPLPLTKWVFVGVYGSAALPKNCSKTKHISNHPKSLGFAKKYLESKIPVIRMDLLEVAVLEFEFTNQTLDSDYQ